MKKTIRVIDTMQYRGNGFAQFELSAHDLVGYSMRSGLPHGSDLDAMRHQLHCLRTIVANLVDRLPESEWLQVCNATGLQQAK